MKKLKGLESIHPYEIEIDQYRITRFHEEYILVDSGERRGRVILYNEDKLVSTFYVTI